jgi:flagellar basal-body rod modification protein FlgD
MADSTVGAVGTQGAQDPTGNNKFESLDLNEFVKLLVAELQNQDPMTPMSNSELLQQVSQIRAIESNDRLTKTLDASMLGQNLSAAGNMLSRYINGLDDDGNRVEGQVTSVSVEDGEAKLHVGDSVVSLKNVAEFA